MPVRSLTQSLLRWPEPEQVLSQVRLWAAQVAADHPGLERVGLFGSYGRGDAGVGSDLDLLLIDTGCVSVKQVVMHLVNCIPSSLWRSMSAISLRLPDHLEQQLNEEARLSGKPRSQLMREALETLLTSGGKNGRRRP